MIAVECTLRLPTPTSHFSLLTLPSHSPFPLSSLPQIKLLKEATPQRELLQRSTTHYTGKRMDERINTKVANVESILI
ncbi:hypothetical protein PEX1_011000 [Penicillium expansum]|uniref:Uncharacterized protein n=1 Tax=Penicillium expansum TaxID=27334 RepID=A0A0A2KUQ1_PENEN|nr:hypothetical protein PEX2_080630 [Penicillium expansum]KGO42414.1 hypothetical protein PEXP_053660 [Penicillium expansum]KGO56456.1 hypothetical protein PEX2_080630 [Penicillium expansum]KGO70633.1 hypothetical protein PEX1_011000 [Penicillium expansum]